MNNSYTCKYLHINIATNLAHLIARKRVYSVILHPKILINYSIFINTSEYK